MLPDLRGPYSISLFLVVFVLEFVLSVLISLPFARFLGFRNTLVLYLSELFHELLSDWSEC